MPYSNTTQNMGLPQYSLNDRPDMDDFNAAFSTIDRVVGIPTQWVATSVVDGGYPGVLYRLTVPNFVFTEGCSVTFKANFTLVGDKNALVEVGGVSYALRTSVGGMIPAGSFAKDATVTVILSKTRFPLEGNDPSGRDGTALYSGSPTYEVGTWIPTLKGTTTAGNPTYLERGGKYVRNGNQVDVYFYINITSKGGIAGNIRIGGLPFASPSTGGGICGNVQGMNLSSGYYLAPFTAENTDIVFRKINNTGVLAVSDTEITDTFRCYSGHVSYLL